MNEAGQELHGPISLGPISLCQESFGQSEHALIVCGAHEPGLDEHTPDLPAQDERAPDQLVPDQPATDQLATDGVRLDDLGPDEPVTNEIESNQPATNAAETVQPEIDQAEFDEAAVDESETETGEPAMDEAGARDQWRLDQTSDEQDFDDDQPDDDVEDSWHRDEELLDRLREWLAETRQHSEEVNDLTGASGETASSAAESQFGLYRLVEEFTALRHELKLQTKSARGLEAESQSQLAALRLAIEAFRSVEPNEALAAWSAGKGLATALADLDEALDRGRTQIERAGRILIDEPTRALPVALDELYSRQSWFKRLLWKSYHRQARELAASHGRKEREALFAALLEGYGLILGRLTRALAAERVERIATLGRAVDPERMIVVELVEAADKPPGSVVDEVRRGYIWNGRILRCAEVRAARDRPQNVLAGVPESKIESIEASTEKTRGEPGVGAASTRIGHPGSVSSSSARPNSSV